MEDAKAHKCYQRLGPGLANGGRAIKGGRATSAGTPTSAGGHGLQRRPQHGRIIWIEGR